VLREKAINLQAPGMPTKGLPSRKKLWQRQTGDILIGRLQLLSAQDRNDTRRAKLT